MGAPGVEPGPSGYKPTALPLSYAPAPCRDARGRIEGEDVVNNRARPEQPIRDLGDGTYGAEPGAPG